MQGIHSVTMQPIAGGAAPSETVYDVNYRAQDTHIIEHDLNELDGQALDKFHEIQELVNKHGHDPAFIQQVKDLLSLDSSRKRRESRKKEEAIDTANAIHSICELMQKIHAILTFIRMNNLKMTTEMRDPQEKTYLQQQSSYKQKGWIQLSGGLIAGLAQGLSGAFGDSAKPILEGLSKIANPISQCFATFKDGKIQGENAFNTRHVDNLLNEDRDHKSQSDQMAIRTFQSMLEMVKSLSSLAETAARKQ